MTEFKNFDYKADALKHLVREALHEQRTPLPNPLRNPYGPEFDAAGWQHHQLDALVNVLRTTDALDVLAALLADPEEHTLTVDDRPVAREEELERHMEKQDVGWSDAWNYFRDQGYNVDHLEAHR